MKVKVNDKVLVVAGKYKGKIGTVMRVFKKTGKITVEKINIITRHIKKTAERPGQRLKYEAPFNASNVMVICPNCNKTTRVAYSIPKTGKKYRVCKKCNESLEKASVKTDTKKK